MFWTPSISWMVLIFTLSSRQSIGVEGGFWLNFAIFKTLHVIEYAILTALNMYALIKTFPDKKLPTLAIIATTISILYAMSDEYHQTFVPTRTGQARDVLIDAVGIFFVYSLAAIYEKNPQIFTSRLRSRKT